MLQDFQMGIFWKISRHRPFVLLVKQMGVSMEHWWNDTDSGNWSAGRKTLYSVGGR